MDYGCPATGILYTVDVGMVPGLYPPQRLQEIGSRESPPRLQCGMCQANPQAVITAVGWSSAACQSYVSRPYWPVIIVLVLN